VELLEQCALLLGGQLGDGLVIELVADGLGGLDKLVIGRLGGVRADADVELAFLLVLEVRLIELRPYDRAAGRNYRRIFVALFDG
jgi:hypothetical protein